VSNNILILTATSNRRWQALHLVVLI